MCFKEQFAKVLSETYISSKLSQEEEFKEWDKIYKLLIPNIPQKLYRFRTCSVDNLISFQKNTILTCTPSAFKDKYDSLVYVNPDLMNEIKKQCTSEALFDVLVEGIEQGTLDEFFRRYIDKDKIDGFVTEFLKLSKEKRKARFQDNGYEILKKLSDDLYNLVALIRNDNLTKIACFSENIQSLNMWDLYADGYKGYALEYDFSDVAYRNCFVCKGAIQCNKKELNYTELFPIIYTDEKFDSTRDAINIVALNVFKDRGFKIDFLEYDKLFWWKSYLYKNKEEYGHEKEWRVITRCPNDIESQYGSISDCNSLKAIYYGPDMEKRYKDFMHEVARQKGIREYDVSIDKNSRKYELKIEEVRS